MPAVGWVTCPCGHRYRRVSSDAPVLCLRCQAAADDALAELILSRPDKDMGDPFLNRFGAPLGEMTFTGKMPTRPAS